MFTKCLLEYFPFQDFQDLDDLALDTSSLLDMDDEGRGVQDDQQQLDLLSDLVDTGGMDHHDGMDHYGMDNEGMDLTDLENFILHDTAANHRIFYGNSKSESDPLKSCKS